MGGEHVLNSDFVGLQDCNRAECQIKARGMHLS